MTKDLLLILPQIVVLLTAIGSLVAEMMGILAAVSGH